MPDQSDEFERLTPVDSGRASASTGGRAPRTAERIDDQQVELHPRGVGGVVDLGFDLIRSRFAACVAIATVIWLPLRLIGTWLRPDASRLTSGDVSALFEFYGQLAFDGVNKWLAQILVSAFTARILFATITGGEATIANAARTALARFPGLLVLGIVALLQMLAGLALCCLPIFAVLWLVTPLVYVYVLEDVGVGAALRRSFALTCGRLFSWPSFYAFWRWAGITITASYLVAPLSLLAEFSESPGIREGILAIVTISPAAFDALSVCIGALFLGVATSIQSAVFTAYYLDCRVRRDGLDLRTWLGRLRAAERPADPAGSAVP